MAKLACLLDPRFKDLHFLHLDAEKKQLYDILEEEMKLWSHCVTRSTSHVAPSPQQDEWEMDVWSENIAPTNPLQDELIMYKLEKRLDRGADPLQWWRENESRFPVLAFLAKRYLCIPASSAPSERLFSKLNIVVSKRRARLSAERSEQLTFLETNFHLLKSLNDK